MDTLSRVIDDMVARTSGAMQKAKAKLYSQKFIKVPTISEYLTSIVKLLVYLSQTVVEHETITMKNLNELMKKSEQILEDCCNRQIPASPVQCTRDFAADSKQLEEIKQQIRDLLAQVMQERTEAFKSIKKVHVDVVSQARVEFSQYVKTLQKSSTESLAGYKEGINKELEVFKSQLALHRSAIQNDLIAPLRGAESLVGQLTSLVSKYQLVLDKFEQMPQQLDRRIEAISSATDKLDQSIQSIQSEGSINLVNERLDSVLEEIQKTQQLQENQVVQIQSQFTQQANQTKDALTKTILSANQITQDLQNNVDILTTNVDKVSTNIDSKHLDLQNGIIKVTGTLGDIQQMVTQQKNISDQHKDITQQTNSLIIKVKDELQNKAKSHGDVLAQISSINEQIKTLKLANPRDNSGIGDKVDQLTQNVKNLKTTVDNISSHIHSKQYEQDQVMKDEMLLQAKVDQMYQSFSTALQKNSIELQNQFSQNAKQVYTMEFEAWEANKQAVLQLINDRQLQLNTLINEITKQNQIYSEQSNVLALLQANTQQLRLDAQNSAAQVIAAQNKLGEIEQQTQIVNTEYQQVISRKDQLQQQIAQLEQTGRNYEQRLQAEDQKIAQQLIIKNQSLLDIDSQIKQQTQQLIKDGQRLQQVDTAFGKMQQDVHQLQGQVNSLTTQIAAKQQELETLNQAVSEQQFQKQQEELKLVRVQNQLEQEINQVNKKKKRLAEASKTLEETKSQIQSQIKLKAKIDEQLSLRQNEIDQLLQTGLKRQHTQTQSQNASQSFKSQSPSLKFPIQGTNNYILDNSSKQQRQQQPSQEKQQPQQQTRKPGTTMNESIQRYQNSTSTLQQQQNAPNFYPQQIDTSQIKQKDGHEDDYEEEMTRDDFQNRKSKHQVDLDVSDSEEEVKQSIREIFEAEADDKTNWLAIGLGVLGATVAGGFVVRTWIRRNRGSSSD